MKELLLVGLKYKWDFLMGRVKIGKETPMHLPPLAAERHVGGRDSVHKRLEKLRKQHES